MVNTRHPCHRSSFSRALLCLISASLLSRNPVLAQSISTSTPVPPLQWINLTSILSGPAPPPLKDASIGYDQTSRTLLIFGGESQQGFPQSQTYLLNLSSLTWTTPNSPDNLKVQPPARSAAISAQDNAASYRTGHIVFGGLGDNGEPLSDVWEYSYNAQFWSEVTVSPGGPSPRWAAAGGNDIRTPSIPDPHMPAPNNSFYVAGGFDSQGAISLSDVWRFNVSGILSANLPTAVTGSWEKLTLQNNSLPAVGGSASVTVFENPDQVITAVGGCSAASGEDAACGEGTSFVIDVNTSNDQLVNACPAPRIGASLTANPSGASSFSNQVFLLLGTFNTSVWQDDGGLNQGEVDILEIDTGTWARVLPAGDPAGGKPAYPTPREGAAVVSYSQALVGMASSPDSVADTIVFGGRDASGTYLSEVWLLRAYDGVITQSNQQWSGYGSGNLQSGINADGEGVTVTYMQNCASQIGQPQPIPTSNQPSPTSGGQSSSSSGAKSGHPFTVYPYDTSTTHRVLAPVSVALVLPAIVLYRLSLPSMELNSLARYRVGFTYLSSLISVAGFALGLVGLATAFTSIKYTSSLAKRTSVPNLTTSHGRAGLALFIGLYGLVPIILAASVLRRWTLRNTSALPAMRTRTTSNDLAEKVALYQGRSGSPGLQHLRGDAPPRVRSGDSLGPWSAAGQHNAGRTSSDSISANDDRSLPSNRSFEVTNRPTRARHASAHSLGAFSQHLNGMSWSAQQRSPSRLDDVDGTLSRRGGDPPTPGTAVMEINSTKTFMDDQGGHPELPPVVESLAHFLLHAFLLGLCIISLIELWKRAPAAPFAVFLAWTVCCYAIILVLAWHGMPRVSILSVLFIRLRADPAVAPPQPATVGLEGISFPHANGPYQHQPPYRTAHESDYPTSISHGGHTLDDEFDDDEDDDTRLRRIEEEMSRRDISIVTVPRRRLQIMNPETREPS